MVAAVLIVRINRRHFQVYIVDNLKALCIAGAHTENNKVFNFLARIFYCNLLAVHLVAYKVFSLREEEILCRADCLKCI